MIRFKGICRRIAMIGLQTMLIFGMVPASVYAAEHTETDTYMEGPVMEESDTEISEDGSGSSSTWTETGSLPTAAGSYVLGNDILLERYWVVDADISLDLNGHTIDRGLKGKNAEYDGCVIFIRPDRTLTITDSSTGNTGLITGGNNADGACGGVYVSSATFNMTGGTITGNTLASDNGFGGGVYVKKGVFNMGGNARISGNNATGECTFGGGVCAVDSTVNMSGNAEITGNTASWGGGIDLENSEFFMSGNTRIAGNTAETNCGGGVRVHKSSFNMSESAIIESNTAVYGGGVQVEDASFDMTGGTITGNTSANNAGVSVSQDKGESTFNMTGGTITDNDGIGVGICGTFNMSGDAKITDNKGKGVLIDKNGTFNMSGGTISGHTADFGAAVDVYGVFNMSGDAKITGNKGSLNVVKIEDNGKFTMDGGTISENEGNVVNAYGEFTLNGGKISSNKGYGVSVAKGPFNMTGGTITGNIDSGVFVSEDGSFTMSGGTISANDGSGVYVKGVFTLSDGRINGNKGKGVVVVKDASFTMSGGTISGNTSDYGAAVQVHGIFNMNGDAKITGNNASLNVVCIEDSGKFTMDGGTISDNEGTGVNACGEFTLNGGTISNNNGNGVCVAFKGPFNMTGGTITGNRTNDVGGGVYLHSGTFNMSGNASIAGNTASNGGGVFVDNYKYDTSAESSDSVFTMSGNASITGNTAAKLGGGGVFIKDGTFNLTGGTITGNSSINYWSGGIYCSKDCTFNISGNPKVLKNYKGGTMTAEGLYIDGIPADIGIQDKEPAISVTGALTEGADLYVCGREDECVAQGTGGYVLTDSDVEKLKTDYWFDVVLREGKAYIESNKVLAVAGRKINLRTTYFSSVTEPIHHFEVDNKKLASISKDTFTGKKAGTVKVTAKKKTGKNSYETVGEISITLIDKPKLKFTKHMTYEGQMINGNEYFVNEDARTLNATYWESSKPNIVEITDAGTGKMTARKSGSAKITAYFGPKDDPSSLKVSATVKVKLPSFAKTEYKLQTGAKLTLSMKNVTGSLNPEWRASVPGMLRVTAQRNNKGIKTGKVIVEGLSCGENTLIATIDGKEYTTKIVVKAPSINKSTMKLKVKKTGTLSLKNTRIKKTDIKWESSNNSIATVDAKGKVTGVSKGEAIIFTDAGGYRNECKVTVK